jgi:tetratricopeptide (TPR) repeat protein
MRNRMAASCLALSGLVSAVQAADTCHLGVLATLPVNMVNTRPVIAGIINGAPARFLADSGAFFSVVTLASAERFKLRLGDLPFEMSIRGVSGEAKAQLGWARDFTLEGFNGNPFHDVDFVVTDSYALQGVDGVIGQNVLGFVDTEYDLGNGVIRLIHAKDCKHGDLAYWSGTTPVSVLNTEERTPSAPHLIGKVKLNGVNIRAVLDTGASTSILNRKAAIRAGFNRDDPGVVPAGFVHGLGPKEIETWIARFDLLDLGGEQIRHAQLRVGDLELPYGADMLLGADFFLSHRLYVSQSRRMVYFTFNGGHVFDLSVEHNSVAATEAGQAENPTDAAGYRRRAAASAARGNLASALADLDAAVKLAPADVENYYKRGMLRLRAQQTAPANEDFGQVLKISPGHPGVLLWRARRRLVDGDKDGAAADFATALRAAPPESKLELDISDIYSETGAYEQALAHLDTWIAAHPADEEVPNALNNRCWTRALMNRGLELALADCDAAIRMFGKKSGSVDALDSRGLVYLRLGNADRATSDYEASLRANPTNAWSLYGLGLAELRRGKQEKGHAHLQAAIAAAPEIAESFKKMGLEP